MWIRAYYMTYLPNIVENASERKYTAIHDIFYWIARLVVVVVYSLLINNRQAAVTPTHRGW